MMLVAGQKLRFKGLNGVDRAKALARELQGSCIREGNFVEMTADTELAVVPEFGSTRMQAPSANGLTARAPHTFRVVDFR